MSEPHQEPLYLPLGSCEIRLLTLYAGVSGEPIQCSLTHAVLQIDGKAHGDLDMYNVDRFSKIKSRKGRERWKQPSYQALSYCWGPKELYKSIAVNGQKVPVQRNLWWALGHLRHRLPGWNQTLWVDALCIDQDNVAERNSQVSIMSSIYSMASKVLIWLGEESADSKAAFKAIAEFLKEPQIPEWEAKERFPSIWNAFFDEHRMKFKSLCERPYWGRLWIIQEVCLASQLQIYCGSDSMDWVDFLRFWKEGLERDTWSSHWLLPCFTKLLEVRKLGRGTLENLIQSSRLFQCTDPRDRIYGILGLLRFPNHALRGHLYLNPEPPAGWELPVIDYSKTTAQLYLDTMRWCIKDGSLDILRLSQHLQEALECPFEGLDPLRSKELDYGDLGQEFSTEILCQEYIHKVGPVIKAEFSGTAGPIRWTTKDGLELENFGNPELGLQNWTSPRNTTPRILNHVVQRLEPKKTMSSELDTDTESISQKRVAEFEVPKLFRLCYTTLGGFWEHYHRTLLCPANVEKGDIISQDLTIILRQGVNQGDKNIVGRAFSVYGMQRKDDAVVRNNLADDNSPPCIFLSPRDPGQHTELGSSHIVHLNLAEVQKLTQ